MRIVIVGAGLGGLALAQSLVTAGDDVTVLERDGSVDDRTGYRIHLTAEACQALRQMLRPALYQAMQASSAASDAFEQFAFTDHRLRVLGLETLPGEERMLIGRSALRRLLARGIEDRIRWGSTVSDVQSTGDIPAVILDDSERLSADLVVGADGSRSVVTAALAGGPVNTEVAIRGTAGRVWLAEGQFEDVPGLLHRGPAIAIGPGGLGMFLSLHRPDRPLVDPVICADEPPEVERASLVWGAMAGPGVIPDDVLRADGPQLLAALLPRLAGWHPKLAGLIQQSDPDEVAGFRFYAADPDRLAAWPAGRVCALGDAVHAMPPTGGQAGSTAIRDAGRLAQHLDGVRSGDVPVGTAIEAYYRDLRGYASAAVRESMQPVPWIARAGRPGWRSIARVALPAVARVTDTAHRRGGLR